MLCRYTFISVSRGRNLQRFILHRFIIDTYRSLFLCLLNLVVHGSLDLLIAGTAEAEAFIKLAFQDVRSELQAAISGVNTGLDDSIALLNKIPGCVLSFLLTIFGD